MSYVNPLHPPVRSGQQSRFSSINCALEPALASSTRRRVPQQIYTSNSKGMPAPSRRHAPITFDHPGYSKQGVQMRELVARSSSALASTVQGAGDAVFVHTGLSRITLKIMWPGYEHLDWANVIELGVLGYGPITRAQLGAAISQHFARFMERARTESSRSFPEWNLTSSGIRFEHLTLISLFHVLEDAWQADVAVDFR